MKAIISDIEGNLEALQAVLEDAARNGADEVYCLGDLIGYCPNPCECIELAMKWKVVLQGNFDRAVLNDPPSLGPTANSATRSLVWSRKRIMAPVPDVDAAEKRWAFLTNLPTTHHEGEFLFVHGNPRDAVDEYIFPEDIYNRRKLTQIFESVDRFCFYGRTHVPGVITEDLEYLSPKDVDNVFPLDDRKVLINAGSVGVSYGDQRASYVLFDGAAMRFCHVEYDFETTIRKIRDIDDLDDNNGDRPEDGL
jgi:predicted phosphodiesterase